MIRFILSILGGCAVALVLAACANFLALHAWPEYAAAFPQRAFTVPMLLVRQTVGMAAALAAGFVASAIAAKDQRPVLWLGVLALLINTPIHLNNPTWSQYPLWYHVWYLGYLVPLPLLGGWLHRRFASEAAR